MKTISNCSGNQTEVRMENRIQKGEMLTPNVIFKLQSIFTEVFQFLGK